MKPELLIEQMAVAERLKNTPRHSWTSAGRRESVAEHSWRLTLLAYFMRDEFPGLDQQKLLEMCLIHDLGEAFTGDIPAFHKGSADEAREEQLLVDWVARLPAPYAGALAALYAEMEARRTPEARVYKALDNLEALLQHNEADLSSWIPLEYDLQFRYGADKVAFSPYLCELRAALNADSRRKIEQRPDLPQHPGYAVVTSPAASIWGCPDKTRQREGKLFSTGIDEALCGQLCRVLTGPGERQADGTLVPDSMAELRTAYGCRGYLEITDLRFLSEGAARDYAAKHFVMVGRGSDVLALPSASSVRLAHLGRGARLEALENPENMNDPAGWQRVGLPDGRTGYLRTASCEPVLWREDTVFAPEGTLPPVTVPGGEAAFRQRVLDAARRYLGVEYRRGGRSGQGVDDAGLVCSAYLQSGVLLGREARIAPGGPLHEIPFEEKKPGDVLYLPEGVALYLGAGEYLCAEEGTSGGVVTARLDPAAPRCTVGSLF